MQLFILNISENSIEFKYKLRLLIINSNKVTIEQILYILLSYNIK